VKRRRSNRRPTKRRSRRDWVYRNDGAALTTGGIVILTADELGTYTPNPLVIGQDDTAGLILYDSRNYLRAMTHGGAGTLGAINMGARAAGKRAQLHWVSGMLFVTTSSWALGSVMRVGFRIGIFGQSISGGNLEAPAGYSMFTNPGESTVADFANQQRANQWEKRVAHAFSADTGAIFGIPVSTRVRGSLNDDECLALFVEGGSDTVGLSIVPWLRTLVTDEG